MQAFHILMPLSFPALRRRARLIFRTYPPRADSILDAGKSGRTAFECQYKSDYLSILHTGVLYMQDVSASN
jgi:hypothetical protein